MVSAFVDIVVVRLWRRILVGGGALLLVASMGCGGEREVPDGGVAGPLSTGVAAPDCAPWDGIATSIYLSESTDLELLPPPAPYLQLIVYEPVARLPDRQVELGRVESGSGLAVRCDEGGGCATSSRGVIRFDARGPDGTLSGSYRLLFAGDTAAGSFIVRWSSRAAICG